jgi:hypothetical protein
MCLICWHVSHWLERPKYVILWRTNVLIRLCESTKGILMHFKSFEMSKISMVTMGPTNFFMYESMGSILNTFPRFFPLL